MMDREQIIQWAREAGATFDMNGENHCFETKEELEAFAKLVAAHEREAIAADADWCIQNHLEHLIPERIRARK